MDIKAIITREYLETLKEDGELDALIPVFLESIGFRILSNPKISKGFVQYGKDIAAVGKDPGDGIVKRFYFEVKGGNDRDITTKTFNKTDGILESLREAKFRPFSSSDPKFEKLPLKIVLVHNGEIHANVKETFDGFIKQEFPINGDVAFEVWSISELTQLFSEHLFGAYLLTDRESTKLFNRTLINLNMGDDVQSDFRKLIERMLFEGEIWEDKFAKKVPRRWMLLFESLKLVSYVIYTESKNEYNNLEIAKRYLSYIVLRFWYWVLKNNLERNKTIIKYFSQVLSLYLSSVAELFGRTVSFTKLRDGIYSEIGGRYEEIGYTIRTFDYIFHFCLLLNVDKRSQKEEFNAEEMADILNSMIVNNNVSHRPLLDIHSVTISSIINFFIEANKPDYAKRYIKEVFAYIKYRKESRDVLPDANNSVKNIIRLAVKSEKSVFYSDSTSPLLNMLFEYVAVLNMEELYYEMREFVEKYDVDLALFVPHHGINSVSLELIEDKENDLEEQLFSKSVHDGYQSDLKLKIVDYDIATMYKELNFSDFKKKMQNRKKEFDYEYRTDKAGFPFLRDLAHHYFMTPYFPDKWRSLLL
ncbi:hypothetical protein D3C87_32450 [compost metagenome]